MTDGVQAAAFKDHFRALTGHVPFRWQVRLFKRMCQGDVPVALDLPTGLGKTSVMAIWLLALAAGAGVPRKLVYVVDRRVVVDQATEVATQLRANLPPDLADVLGLDDRALPISTLRGAFADNRDWLVDPSKPAVVVGTVDMIGSRLLFEGYGVSRRIRPYQAGILGIDTLLVLDEAHLCAPFEALLKRVADRRDGTFGLVGLEANIRSATPPPFRLMSLSATGRDRATGAPVFRLADEDKTEPTVRRRLTAANWLSVATSTIRRGWSTNCGARRWRLSKRPQRTSSCIATVARTL